MILGGKGISRPARRLALALGRRGAALAVSVSAALAAPAAAQDPLSAIDWLRDNLTRPEAGAYPISPLEGGGWTQDAITIRLLDATRPESVGLFSAARAGLPRAIWGPSPDTELAALIRALPVDTLPALRDLSYRLLLAEFDAPEIPQPPASRPPQDTGTTTETDPETRSMVFLLARIDKLIEFGAIDQAAALLDALEPVHPDLRLRRFEIALLLGQEQRACETMRDAARPFPSEPATIFCRARQGDWEGAQARLEDARAAGSLGPLYGPLIEHFLDADDHLHNGGPLDIGRPMNLSPLAWRLLEAIGAPVATHGLPVAFAHADLRGTIGWRAQLEAAERLVRSGALPPNHLLGLYTERSAAASGGIWERVRAVQRLERALEAGDTGATGAALLTTWLQMVEGELEVAFASLYADALLASGLTGEALDLAVIVGLLSENYEQVALDHPGTSPRARFLNAVARGLTPGTVRDGEDARRDPARAAIAEAFAETPPVSEAAQQRLADGRLGEVLLGTLITLGAAGDPRAMIDALATLRHIGLEDVARRAALQSLLLERRG
ncbi:MAG TPA: hypothetical protein GX700_19350 [Paracoccus sp.]|nr:hypothetical protein [Paracoccus sp. (in: a-proteobacteria)]